MSWSGRIAGRREDEPVSDQFAQKCKGKQKLLIPHLSSSFLLKQDFLPFPIFFIFNKY